ncbi:MAG: uncharacterized protein QOJ39_1596 [Candidatus Eremiobacteraeota bacterium]|jgi:uncharacterized protein|nr:uncharacterized protein [Candidatus Eremiobacteraeota bacterium]
MSAVRGLLALLMLIGLGTAVNGAEVSIPPSPARWATDTSGFLKPQTVAALDARLRAYQSSTGHQVLVYVSPTTGATPTEDWTVRAFRRWKVGRKGMDDGLILFVFPTDRKVRIEVGYGLEQTVPDAIAARIIRDTITPKLRAGQPDEAVTAGVDALLGTIGGEARGTSAKAQGKNVDARGTDDVPRPRAVAVPVATDFWSTRTGEVIGESAGVIFGLLIAIGIIVLIAKLPSPKGPYISSRSSGFGWGALVGGLVGGLASGGGGFSGGGGMSGGGGATGSW